MFSATISDIRTFRAIMEAVQALIIDGNFYVSKEGLSLRAMDQSHAAMVDLNMKDSFFRDFECEEDSFVCVSMEDLRKILARVQKDDLVKLSLDSSRNSLIVELEGQSDSLFGKRTFIIPLKESDQQNIPAPDLPLDVKVKLQPSMLKEVVADMGVVAQNVEIFANEDKIMFSTKSSGHEVKAELDKDKLLQLDTAEDANASYGLEYLKNMVKLDALATEITLEVATARPMRLTFQVDEDVTLRYLLAPYDEPEEE
ncbi:MAG: proliferating cell nuclear antigen (pcna) [Candidatus Hodarchaeota archaeon]